MTQLPEQGAPCEDKVNIKVRDAFTIVSHPLHPSLMIASQ